MNTLDFARLRMTVEFAKRQGWIKDPPPRAAALDGRCLPGRKRHHYKAGICHFCAMQKPSEAERAKRYDMDH